MLDSGLSTEDVDHHRKEVCYSYQSAHYAASFSNLIRISTTTKKNSNDSWHNPDQEYGQKCNLRSGHQLKKIGI